VARKKKKGAVNKAAEVRAYMAAHPEAKNKEIREALAKKGIKIAPNYATVIKSQMKAKEEGRRRVATGRRGRPPRIGGPKRRIARVGRRPRAAAAAAVDIDRLTAAAEFAQLCGGTENAVEALQAAEAIYQKMCEAE
jgi:hypothetical protein